MNSTKDQRPSPGSRPGDGRCPVSGAKVAVVTDNAAALPPAWQDEFEASGVFACVELPVLIGGQLYTEDEADMLSSLVIALAEGRPVTTSRPAPGQLRKIYAAFQAAGFEAIVSVHLSAELSGTLGAARIARQDIDIPVRLVDTHSAALGQGLGVRAAVQAALAGQGIDDVAAAASAASAESQVLIQVNSLETLRRGGRINPTSAMLGTMLQIKPLLSLHEGKIVTVERPVSAIKARGRFMTLMGEALANSEQDSPVLCIHHVSDPHGARELGETLVDRYRPDAQLILSELPAVLSAHVGLGTKAAIVEGPTNRPIAHGNRAAPAES